MPKRKRTNRVNRYRLTIRFNQSSINVYGRSIEDLRVKFSEQTKRRLKVWAILKFSEADQITSNWWIGSSVTTCNQRVFWDCFDLVGEASNAGAILGRIGGSNGYGESKRRGDSEYYNKLRQLGLKKRLKNKEKKESQKKSLTTNKKVINQHETTRDGNGKK
jgi:hypothetical protein